MRWKPPEGGAHACAGQRRALPDARGGSVNRSASERGAAPPNAAVTEEVRPVHRTPSALRSCPPSHAPVAHRLLVKAAAGQRGQPFRLLAQRACYPLWQRHIRGTPCAWWQGTPGARFVQQGVRPLWLVTLRCALLRASSAAHYLGAGYRWKPPHQDSGELGALSWAYPMVLRGRARGYASTGPLGPSLRKGGFDLTCCMAAAAGSGMRRRLAAAASSGGLRRRLAVASAARKV